MGLLKLGLIVFLVVGTAAHSRLACPTARSQLTGIKNGPCGGDGVGPITTISPGLLTIKIEESVRHVGTPFRVSLSADGDDNNACVLLDHIPANPNSRPVYNNPTTYTPYYITVEIPNVACERCSLQLSNPMTDKIGRRGWTNCTFPASYPPGVVERYCFSVYHSCSDVRITGRIPRNNYTCPVRPPPGWPLRPPQYLPSIYPQVNGIWSSSGLLMSTINGGQVDSRYRRGCGACASLQHEDGPCEPSMSPTSSVPTTTPPTSAPSTRTPTSAGVTFSPTLPPSTSHPTLIPTTTAPTSHPTVFSTVIPSTSADADSNLSSDGHNNSDDSEMIFIIIGVVAVMLTVGLVFVVGRRNRSLHHPTAHNNVMNDNFQRTPSHNNNFIGNISDFDHHDGGDDQIDTEA